jgi:hypothetical protein
MALTHERRPRPEPAPAADALAPTPDAPVRLALLLDGFEQPAWVDYVLRELLREGLASVDAVALNTPPADDPAPGPGRLGRYWRNRAALPFAAYQRFDRARYPVDDDPLRPVDVSPLLAGVPVVPVVPRRTKFSDYFDAPAVARLREVGLDVALRFGFRILKGEVLEVARHGVWSFHHGDHRVNRGGPAGFWEVAEGHPVTGAILQRLTEELDGGVVLGRSLSRTEPFSHNRNRANYYWQAAHLLLAAVRRLARCGDPRDPALDDDGAWGGYDRRLYTAPTARELGRAALRLGTSLARAKVRALTSREQWRLAYRFDPAGARPGVPDGVLWRFREIVPPGDRYWADPFPVRHGDAFYVFHEEHLAGRPNAHLNVLTLDPKTGPGPSRPVLQLDCHLSYPYVFEWQGGWYMVPETAGRRAVQLFRAERFPDGWVHVADLLTDIDAVDSTLVEARGRWWMFVGVMLRGATEATALHVYHADSPLGPWTPHAGNPVRVDVLGARPGGRPFTLDGALYRPAQCGAPRYGASLVVHRVDVLDPERYRETPVARLEPRWRRGLLGLHTLAAADNLTVVDVLARRRP